MEKSVNSREEKTPQENINKRRQLAHGKNVIIAMSRDVIIPRGDKVFLLEPMRREDTEIDRVDTESSAE